MKSLASLSFSRCRGLLVGLAVASSAVWGAGCSAADTSSQSSEVRSVSNEEALADFDQLTASMKSLYGALERKEARYGFKIDDLVREYRGRVERATVESEYIGIFLEFLGRFKDAHISLSAPLMADTSHAFSLPINVMPVEDTFVVYNVKPGTDVKVGDELVAIDGQKPADLVEQFAKYVSVPNELSARHMTASSLTRRSSFLSKGISSGSKATLRLRGADGAERTATVAWAEAPHQLPPPAPPRAGESTQQTVMALSATASEAVKAELARFGDPVPFYMTKPVAQKLGFQTVVPSSAALAKYNVSEADAKANAYFAGTYKLDGKQVLLLRLPSYMPENEEVAFNWLQALIDDQQSKVDALVLDETHNVGGSLFFAHAVMSLLSAKPLNSFVAAVHGDRLWVQTYVGIANQVRPQAPDLADALLAEAKVIDAAYTSKKNLTAPFPMFASDAVIQSNPVHWEKPLLVLADELSVSCGDIVPSLVKANHVAPIFGQRTMGGGGNVEQVATLTNTRWELAISRSLGMPYDPSGAYPEAAVIEDNGVTPDVSYSHTLSDFRAGYVGYVDAFNATLAQQFKVRVGK